MIAFAFALCADVLTVYVNGRALPCNPGTLSYYPAARELRIGPVIVVKPSLKQYPDRLVITGAEAISRSGFE